MELLQTICFAQRLSFRVHCVGRGTKGKGLLEWVQTLWVNFSGNLNCIWCGNVLVGGRDCQNDRVWLPKKDNHVTPWLSLALLVTVLPKICPNPVQHSNSFVIHHNILNVTEKVGMRLPSQCKIGPCFLYLQQWCLIAHLQKQADHDQNVCKLAKEQE
jgi:hypothetical protein